MPRASPAWEERNTRSSSRQGTWGTSSWYLPQGAKKHPPDPGGKSERGERCFQARGWKPTHDLPSAPRGRRRAVVSPSFPRLPTPTPPKSGESDSNGVGLREKGLGPRRASGYSPAPPPRQPVAGEGRGPLRVGRPQCGGRGARGRRTGAVWSLREKPFAPPHPPAGGRGCRPPQKRVPGCDGD